jgi:phosphatidylinositol glycan class B
MAESLHTEASLTESLIREYAAADPSWKRSFIAGSLISLCVIICASWFSVGFHAMDEYFQEIEFTGMKLGKTTPDQLAWEYNARGRQWMQPCMYYCVAKALSVAGIRDSFIQLFFFKLISGLLGWLALIALAWCSRTWLADQKLRIFQLNVLFFMWYFPFLFARTSSENLSASLFALGFAAVLMAANMRPAGRRGATAASMEIASGVLLGLAFEMRFQVAIMIAALLLWLILVKRCGLFVLLRISAGICIAILAGIGVDYWGYGECVVMPWRYFRIQILDGVVNHFRILPVYAYCYLILQNAMLPVMLALMILCVVAWIRHPLNPITWCTVAFVAVHCLIGHKEARFLFPMSILAACNVGLAFAPNKKGTSRFLARIWEKRYSPWFIVLYVWNIAGLAFVTIDPISADIMMQKFIRKEFGSACEIYTINYDPFMKNGLRMTFHAPASYRPHTLTSYDELRAILREKGNVVFSAYQRDFPPDAADIKAGATVLYSAVSYQRRLLIAGQRIAPKGHRRFFNSGWDGKRRYLYRLEMK